MKFQKPNRKKIKENLKEIYDFQSKAEDLLKQLEEQKEILIKERDGIVGTKDPS